MSHPHTSKGHTEDQHHSEPLDRDAGASIDLAKTKSRGTGSSGRKITPTPTPTSTGKGLTKISANLVPRAVVALQQATEVTGDNATDVLNRAIQLYAYIAKAIDEGKLVFIEDAKAGDRERLVLL
jgi:hypothetical protein